jgi:hypothetical protein
MAFDSPGLVGGVHLDLQGACVRFNARFADSTFQVPFFRGQGSHVCAAHLTESLLLVTCTMLGCKLFILSAAENHFHSDRSVKGKDSGFAGEAFAF